MNRRAVWILYTRELRSALRERTIVVNSLLMPVFLYPVLLWVMFSALTFVQGLNEGFTSRVVLTNAVPAGHEGLLDSLQAREDMVMLGEMGEEEALSLLREGEADAVVTFVPPPPEGLRLRNNFQVEVRFDRAENRSSQARARMEAVVDGYRDGWIIREAEALGLGREERSVFAIVSESVSTSRDLGALLLGQMISLFLVIMVALGCFVPAVDTTAGERERSTWETLMTVAASRASVVTAKYLYVATLGI
ncbi:MAG TPA: ABC transporter permease subunit, partial [Longimicrobiales bacterium]|nr:ABC transporter permease subunit [Longimicrobiales bacterium]